MSERARRGGVRRGAKSCLYSFLLFPFFVSGRKQTNSIDSLRPPPWHPPRCISRSPLWLAGVRKTCASLSRKEKAGRALGKGPKSTAGSIAFQQREPRFQGRAKTVNRGGSGASSDNPASPCSTARQPLFISTHLDLVDDHRQVGEIDDGLGNRERQRAQARPETADENESSDHVFVFFRAGEGDD